MIELIETLGTSLPLASQGKLRYHDRMDSKRNQDGGVGTILLVVVLVVMLGGALAVGVWANNGRTDYKNNVDAKIATAVAAAKQQQTTADDAQFAQVSKDPLRSYDGPEAYGSLVVNYPKTWSAYVDDSGAGNALVDGYFAPGTVPSISAQGSVFALRVQVVSQSYSQSVQNFTGQQQNGKLSSQAYALPKVPKVVGLEITGTLPDSKTGTMVVLPLRSETLEIWTEGTSYLSDFNNNILPNLSFSP
jgi:hypothetical protein